jgi:aspartate aminotransferase-like enzyme
MNHNEFSRILHEIFEISVASTFGDLAGKVFRVGPAGLLQISPTFTLHLTSSLDLAFRRMGHPVDIDEALAVDGI